MSKKKRNKPPTVVMKKSISHVQLERCHVIARKVLRHFELDPDLLGYFSKKQKHILFRTIYETPSVKPEKENTVPRQYVENIRREVLIFLKTNYFGNPENQLTFMELATYGLGFFMTLYMQVDNGIYVGTPQEEIAQRIYDRIKDEQIFETGFEKLFVELTYQTRTYSQVNFRLYGFTYDWKSVNSKTFGALPMQMQIRLTVENCKWKMFTHHNIERKAYQLILPARGLMEPTWAIIRKEKIFPKANPDEDLNIFIQSHVLHRLKERLDTFEPPLRNFFIQYALTHGQLVVTNDEKQKLLACTVYNNRPLGYFTFFIQGEDIVINTFIPLASENTPEGKKFHELLPLSKEEMSYLGMDKLSFFAKVDFERIPVLKQAFITSGIWNTKLELDRMIDTSALEEGETPIDEQKTMFVKSFFDKIEQHRSTEYVNDSDISPDQHEINEMKE